MVIPQPPCPMCGSPLDVVWVDVTDLSSAEPRYMPVQAICPEDHRHSTSAALREFDWPETLTADDRAWLRKMRDVA